MSLINSPQTAISCLLAFMVLAYFSLHEQQGYTHSVFDVLPLTFKEKQANALMEIYSLTDEDIKAPIRLFGD